MTPTWAPREAGGATTIDPVDGALAAGAGEALPKLPGARVVDARVMASAARTGGVVSTSDVDDPMRLQTHFAVRVLGV